MKTAVLGMILLCASTVGAETTIEYQETPYVQPPETGASGYMDHQVIEREDTKPLTNLIPLPPSPQQRREELQDAIQRLQDRRAEVLAEAATLPPDEAEPKLRRAEKKAKRIGKMQSELLKLPAQ